MTDETIITEPAVETVPAESTPQALETAASNIAEDVKQDTPGVIAHLESYANWTEEEIKAAFHWLEAKL